MDAKNDILIVDDDKNIVNALIIILEMEDYTVRATYSGAECLEEAKKAHPSLLLLDLMLPDMHGKDVAKQLAKDSNTKNIPIVVISASREAKKVAMEIGAKNCIEKPFGIQDLLEVVSQYAAKRSHN